ncbi:MAG TPA: hypothetical protein VGL93_17240 [Streptosporangiaceae bacterium]|jgi:hypothetical protein
MATFRDLATEADRHLVTATKRIGTLSQAEAAQVARELAMLARTCGRILDDVVDGRPDHTTDGAPWIRAAQDTRDRVGSCERQLVRAATAYAPDETMLSRRAPGPAAPLRAAVRHLGLAEELLQADLSVGANGTRAPKAAGPYGLGDPDTARELVDLTGRWIGLVGEVTGGLASQIQIPRRSFRVDVEPTIRLFQQVADSARHVHTVLTATTGQRAQASERLALLPRSRTGEQRPLIFAVSDVNELLRHGAENAKAVRAALQPKPWRPKKTTPPHRSAPAMRYTATSAGSAHANAAIVVRQLAARATELSGPPDTRRALERGAEALIDTAHAWYSAGRAWDGLITTATHLADPAVHSTGAVMKLGRAAFADPDWTPASRNAPVRPAAEFATDTDTLRAATTHIHDLVATYAGTARSIQRAISELHNDRAIHHTRADGRTSAAPDERVAALHGAYADVIERTVTAEHWLRSASAPGRSRLDAPALASADFPTPPLAHTDPDATDQPPDARTAAPARHARRA